MHPLGDPSPDGALTKLICILYALFANKVPTYIAVTHIKRLGLRNRYNGIAIIPCYYVAVKACSF